MEQSNNLDTEKLNKVVDGIFAGGAKAVKEFDFSVYTNDEMKNPGASSWVSSLDRKFIVLAMVHTPIRKSAYNISWGGKFPEQAPGYGPSLPIKYLMDEWIDEFKKTLPD